MSIADAVKAAERSRAALERANAGKDLGDEVPAVEREVAFIESNLAIAYAVTELAAEFAAERIEAGGLRHG